VSLLEDEMRKKDQKFCDCQKRMQPFTLPLVDANQCQGLLFKGSIQKGY
jgi:hypothetical protein